MISSREREGPKHQKDPPILPEGALSAPSIKGNIPYYFSQKILKKLNILKDLHNKLRDLLLEKQLK